MIMVEMVHDTRIVPLYSSAEEARANRRPEELQQWLGDSVGWYEGDTLTIETVNINPLQMGQSSIPISSDQIFVDGLMMDGNTVSVALHNTCTIVDSLGGSCDKESGSNLEFEWYKLSD